MITLEGNSLVVRFPEVHRLAESRISFQRTLRIPDDGENYPLPPGFGEFPIHHVDDHAQSVPRKWTERGGVFLPMYQSEALWINFSHEGPIALQIAAGKINAVNGEDWREDMQREPQSYVVTDQQPWLDGFCVEKDIIRQFVAAPLGTGATVEEQLTGEAEFGGIQVKAWPLKRERYLEFERALAERPMFCGFEMDADYAPSESSSSPEMGLGMGGRMRQQIYEDFYDASDWDLETSSRCFIHLVNSEAYAEITGQLPPYRPYCMEDYVRAGLPWFDYYDDAKTLEGAGRLRGLRTVREFGG
jgi:hypothetical protein